MSSILRRLNSALAEVDGDRLTYVPASIAAMNLRWGWSSHTPDDLAGLDLNPTLGIVITQAMGSPGHASYSMAHPVLHDMDSGWAIGITGEFRKSTVKIDRKLQGRIHEAIMELSEDPNPITPKGDTIKPLTGDRAGQWRYRIGDSRLVYLPNTSRRTVTLLLFAARGSVYLT